MPHTLHANEYHDALGSRDDCQVCNSQEPAVAANSWLALLHHLSQQSTQYSDRQLPMIHFISTLTQEEGEKRVGNIPKKWRQKLPRRERFEILCNTGPTLQHDVLPLLKLILVQCLLPLYQQLLPSASLKVTRERPTGFDESSRWILRDNDMKVHNAFWVFIMVSTSSVWKTTV